LRLITVVLVSIVIVVFGVSGVSLASDATKIKKSDIQNKLLFLRNDDIWAYNVENKSEKRLTSSRDIRNYTVSADATKIAYIRALKKLYVYDTESGAETFIADVTTDASQPSFSPLGDKIALISHTKEEMDVRLSYFFKPVKERVRHIIIIDIKFKKIDDVTQDVPFPHSQVKWSPDGRWISFASFRFGFFDKLYPFSAKKWAVYLMDLSNSKHKTTEIGGGMSSVWISSDQVVISDGVAANVLSFYDIKTKTLKPSTMIQAGFSPALFTLGGMNNEIVYYETAEGPDSGLIRSHNIKTNKTEDVVMDAAVPLYVK
jgi:hypothetical protein